jgi:hypothetical protein
LNDFGAAKALLACAHRLKSGLPEQFVQLDHWQSRDLAQFHGKRGFA